MKNINVIFFLNKLHLENNIIPAYIYVIFCPSNVATNVEIVVGIKPSESAAFPSAECALSYPDSLDTRMERLPVIRNAASQKDDLISANIRNPRDMHSDITHRLTVPDRHGDAVDYRRPLSGRCFYRVFRDDGHVDKINFGVAEPECRAGVQVRERFAARRKPRGETQIVVVDGYRRQKVAGRGTMQADGKCTPEEKQQSVSSSSSSFSSSSSSLDKSRLSVPDGWPFRKAK